MSCTITLENKLPPSPTSGEFDPRDVEYVETSPHDPTTVTVSPLQSSVITASADQGPYTVVGHIPASQPTATIGTCSIPSHHTAASVTATTTVIGGTTVTTLTGGSSLPVAAPSQFAIDV